MTSWNQKWTIDSSMNCFSSLQFHGIFGEDEASYVMFELLISVTVLHEVSNLEHRWPGVYGWRSGASLYICRYVNVRGSYRRERPDLFAQHGVCSVSSKVDFRLRTEHLSDSRLSHAPRVCVGSLIQGRRHEDLTGAMPPPLGGGGSGAGSDTQIPKPPTTKF